MGYGGVGAWSLGFNGSEAQGLGYTDPEEERMREEGTVRGEFGGEAEVSQHTEDN